MNIGQLLSMSIAQTSSKKLSGSRHPVGKHDQLFIALIGVVIGDMYPEIVHAFHTFVHHEAHRNGGLLARIKDHRTDGRYRRSAAFQNFYVWLFAELQRLIADIGQLKRYGNSLAQRDISQIHLILVHFQAG